MPGAVVGLRELLGEVVEVGEVLEHAGAVAEPEPLLAVEPLRAAPVLAGAQRLQVGVELARAAASARGEPNACCGERIELRRAARRSSSCSIRWAAAARWASASMQLVDVLRVLREEVAVLVHELVEVLVRCPRRGGASRAAR